MRGRGWGWGSSLGGGGLRALVGGARAGGGASAKPFREVSVWAGPGMQGRLRSNQG